MLSREQQQEAFEYLDAHLHAVHCGLQALLDLLSCAPAGKAVQAASLRVLLAPLADEASQAHPLAAMLARRTEELMQ